MTDSTPHSHARREDLGEPSFRKLSTGIVQQALVHLGMFPDPATNERRVDLAAAKYTIDMLEVIAKKTEGNLDAGEKRYLDTSLYELRMAYIAASKQKA